MSEENAEQHLPKRSKREGRLLTASMRSIRLGEQPIVVCNLSSRGVGARTHGLPPSVGEEVVLTLYAQELVGRVRWVRDSKFGIHLRDAIAKQEPAPAKVWPQQTPVSPGFQVLERFNPVAKAWRPGVKSGPPSANRRPGKG